MDQLDTLLSRIVERVSQSQLSETEKADVFASLSLGMRRLVWPILMAHMPEKDLANAVDNPKDWCMDRYTSLIEKALSDPQTPKEIYDELMGALSEVDQVVTTQIRSTA